jgi:hypothetical protein
VSSLPEVPFGFSKSRKESPSDLSDVAGRDSRFVAFGVAFAAPELLPNQVATPP